MSHRRASVDLGTWIRDTTGDAVAYAKSLLRDRSWAEDVVQDCYCRLLARAHVYDLAQDGRKLLFESVTNACINQTRRARPTAPLDPHRLADRTTQTALSMLLERELEQAIDAALGRLPPLQRKALELKNQGHPLDEIAAATNITPTYAGVLSHRARQAIARELGPAHVTGG